MESVTLLDWQIFACLNCTWPLVLFCVKRTIFSVNKVLKKKNNLIAECASINIIDIFLRVMEDGCTINFPLSSFFWDRVPVSQAGMQWHGHSINHLGLSNPLTSAFPDRGWHYKHVCLANFLKKICVELGSHYVAHAGGLPVKENPY